MLAHPGRHSEDHIVINAGNAACGYGFEYLVSTMERIRAAAHHRTIRCFRCRSLPDRSGFMGTKEAQAGEEDMPGWGDRLERGRKMEIMSAVGVPAAGSDAVIVRDPFPPPNICTGDETRRGRIRKNLPEAVQATY